MGIIQIIILLFYFNINTATTKVFKIDKIVNSTIYYNNTSCDIDEVTGNYINPKIIFITKEYGEEDIYVIK